MGVLALGLLAGCTDDGGGEVIRDQFMIGDVGPEMATPPPMDMGRFPQVCVDLVMRTVACGIVPGDQAAASLQACADSDPALRADRAGCVADAADCEAVFACLSAPPPDGGVEDGGPPDAGLDQGVPDAAPADQGADMNVDMAADAGALPGACPAEWAVAELAAGPDGRFGVADTTEGALVQVGPASCGGGAGDRIYRFTPPAGGPWRFETFSDALDVDTVLSVRADCGAVESELGCNDDAAADQFTSVVEVELAAGVPVWVVVDGLTNPAEGYAWQGPFRLEARPVER
ncbi:MAG: hypothetical protein KC613_17350 [Myxococcales bacterium]|nr:hypothetical protein [Myxococcales bacterium]